MNLIFYGRIIWRKKSYNWTLDLWLLWNYLKQRQRLTKKKKRQVWIRIMILKGNLWRDKNTSSKKMSLENHFWKNWLVFNSDFQKSKTQGSSFPWSYFFRNFFPFAQKSFNKNFWINFLQSPKKSKVFFIPPKSFSEGIFAFKRNS